MLFLLLLMERLIASAETTNCLCISMVYFVNLSRDLLKYYFVLSMQKYFLPEIRLTLIETT